MNTLAIDEATFAPLAMITRYPVYIYLGLVFSISAINNGRKIDQRRRTTSVSGGSGLVFVLTASLSVYYPLLSGAAVKAP
ncbi:BQ2448_1131 [Microbotryum intermedium]|uniref:BQ2448_1131 protein n=1 Tax=Microbotryum intermedium TaxID=269621 RepID=A0A238F9B7_9BASI|nr:BQ2448_1131 [Microbotryum intermedium]